MQLKTLSSQTLLMAALAGLTFSLALSLHVVSKKREANSRAPLATNTAEENINSPLPVRLKIPKIHVDAAVELMGLTPDGAMEAPKRGRNVGWFSSGPHPGDIGSAVIDGHYGRWKNGEGSVFDNLNRLEKGDSVYIEDEAGVITPFVVREFRSYDPNADASDVFDSSDGKSHLNLITCEGVWNKNSKSYSKRLVVFTDKE